MVDLHDGRFMIISGGKRWRKGEKTVLIYNSYNASFTSGPSLRTARWFAACTLFQSPKHNKRWVVLVVGGGGSREAATSEVLDFTVPNAVWEEYVPLPVSDIPDRDYGEYHGMRAVTYEKEVYLVHLRSIYRLICSSHFCFWRKMQMQLDIIGNYGTMMVLPEEYTCQD